MSSPLKTERAKIYSLLHNQLGKYLWMSQFLVFQLSSFETIPDISLYQEEILKEVKKKKKKLKKNLSSGSQKHFVLMQERET